MKAHFPLLPERRWLRRVLSLGCFLCLSSILAIPQAWSAPKVDIAMILFRGETPSERGFKDTLRKSKEFEFNFEIFDANQSKEKLATIIHGLDRKKYGVIYTFGTMATQQALKEITDTPIVFNVVQRPVEAGIIRSWESSGNNATGASNIVPMESAFKTLALVMQIRKLGFIYSAQDPAPRFQREEIEKQQKKFGFRMVDLPIASKETIPQTLKAMLDAKVDAVIFPSDSFVKANAGTIVGTLNKHRIPSIVIIPEMVKENGALLSLGPDYYTLGVLAAENALAILKGKKPMDVPTRTVSSLSISINLRTAEKLGVIFPLQLLKLSKIIN